MLELDFMPVVTTMGAVVGQNKGNTLESFQFMKAKVELYDNTKQ